MLTYLRWCAVGPRRWRKRRIHFRSNPRLWTTPKFRMRILLTFTSPFWLQDFRTITKSTAVNEAVNWPEVVTWPLSTGLRWPQCCYEGGQGQDFFLKAKAKAKAKDMKFFKAETVSSKAKAKAWPSWGVLEDNKTGWPLKAKGLGVATLCSKWRLIVTECDREDW